MSVLVDTCIWSLALRRQAVLGPDAVELSQLIAEGQVEMIGPIRQEILSGIARASQFEALREQLAAFEDIPLERRHFELAAEFNNRCRRHGVQGSHTDFLICAVGALERARIYTSDKDFKHYAKWLPIQLHARRA